MKSFLPLVLAGFLSLAVYAEEWSPLPADHGSVIGPIPAIPANAPELNYVGRFDHSDPKVAISEWPNSAVRLKFRGTGAKASLALHGNRVVVAVDGQPNKMLVWDDQTKVEQEPRTYVLAEKLPDGEHEITLTKATETYFGPLRVFGFDLDAGGKLLPTTPASKRITVIGDSISAGAGNESNDKTEHTNADNENAWWTYGAITARTFAADYTALAWSGRKLWPNNTLPEIYGRTLPSKPDSTWPGDQAPPDVILVNLCTNDFNKTNPEEEGWVKAYLEFLTRLRKEAPNAAIYCAIGNMMSDFWPPENKARSTAIKYIQRVVAESNAAGDANVRFLDFGIYDKSHGIGADWHPTVRSHQSMAETFTAAIAKDLHWKTK